MQCIKSVYKRNIKELIEKLGLKEAADTLARAYGMMWSCFICCGHVFEMTVDGKCFNKANGTRNGWKM